MHQNKQKGKKKTTAFADGSWKYKEEYRDWLYVLSFSDTQVEAQPAVLCAVELVRPLCLEFSGLLSRYVVHSEKCTAAGCLSPCSCPPPATERRREGPRPTQPQRLQPAHPRPQGSDRRAEARGELGTCGDDAALLLLPLIRVLLVFSLCALIWLFVHNSSLNWFDIDTCQLHPETSCVAQSPPKSTCCFDAAGLVSGRDTSRTPGGLDERGFIVSSV